MRTLGGVPHSSIDIGDALADVAHRLGQNKVAAEVYQALLPVAHRLGQMRPNDVDAAKPEVVLHGNLTAVLLGPEPARDVERTTQHIALMRGLIDRFPKALGLKEELAMDLAKAAAAFVVAGDLAQAADSYRESIEMREDILRGDPHNTGLQRGLIVANGNYARVLGVPWSPNLGRFAEARVAGAKAVAIARAMVAADPKDANARFDLAMSLSRLGSIEPEPDGARDSLAFLQEAIALMEPTLKSNPKALGIVSQLAVAYDFAGHRLESLGNPEEAAKQYQASSDVGRLLDPEHNAGRASVAGQDLALLYASSGDRAQAFDYARRALAEAERYAAAPSSDIRTASWARSYFVLASVHSRFGEFADARRAAEKALELWRLVRDPGVLALHQKAIEKASELLKKVETQDRP
jgi:tetratricopeptide (TPR) repeat protein